jgi:hypothetical protein
VSSEQVSVFDRRYGGQVSAEWSFTDNQGIIITSGSFCGSDSEGVPAGAVDFNIDINGLGQASACPVPTTPVAGTVTVTFS